MKECDLSKVFFSPLTVDDYVSFFGKKPEHTVFGVSVIYDGQVKGIVGGYLSGSKYILFSDFSDIDSYGKKFRYSVAKKIVVILSGFRYPLYTYTVSSDKLLQRLGFRFSRAASPYGNEYLLSK